MKKIKKDFNLIELVAVITIMGILAGIIIVNIADFKKETIAQTVHANIRILQVAVDSYYLKEKKYPTEIQPTLENPQLINIEELYPKHIKSKPDYDKIKKQKYWVDVYGQVWGSTVDSPTNILEGTDTLEWSHNKDVVGYNLYEITNNVTTGKVDTKKIRISATYPVKEHTERVRLEKPSTQFLLSSIDQYGLESAPSGLNYQAKQDGFQPFGFQPLKNKEGEFIFEITANDIMYWDDFHVVEDKPNGTNIEYFFSVQNKEGIYQNYINDFTKLSPSKGIKIKVKMTGSNGKFPSLWDMKVYYHFQNQNLDEFQFVSSSNLSNHKPINPNLPIEIVEEFTLPQGQKIKDIKIEDYYVVPPKIEYFYKPTNQINFSPIQSFSDVPSGSTIKIIKTYPAQSDFFMFPTIIEYKENVQTKHLEPENSNSSISSPAKEPVEEWETVQRINFFAHASQVVDWIRVETTDNQPEGTRILYKYAISNGDGWSNEIEDFENVPNSKSIRVSAYLQVKKLGNVTEPTVSHVRIYHDKGFIDINQGIQGDVFPNNTNIQASSSCGGAPASNANDGDINTMWNACGYSGWIQYHFENPTKIKGIQIVNEATPSTYQTFTFKGYKNGQWIDLGTQNVYTSQRPHIHNPIMIPEDTYEALYIHVNGGASWAAIREILLIQ